MLGGDVEKVTFNFHEYTFKNWLEAIIKVKELEQILETIPSLEDTKDFYLSEYNLYYDFLEECEDAIIANPKFENRGLKLIGE